jgi:hypothetical protein
VLNDVSYLAWGRQTSRSVGLAPIGCIFGGIHLRRETIVDIDDKLVVDAECFGLAMLCWEDVVCQLAPYIQVRIDRVYIDINAVPSHIFHI